jgi:hypothetical protein
VKNNKASRNIKYNPEPEYSGFIQDQHDKTYNDKGIQPYDIQVAFHLLMIGEKVEEDH